MALMRRLTCTVVGGWLVMLAVIMPAYSGDNDLVLSRYGHFVENSSENCVNACGVVEPNHIFFENLVTDLGQVLAPKLASPADTLGQAGFAFNILTTRSAIPHERRYWQLAVENQDPSEALQTTYLQLRKGLPFSFEVGGNAGHLYKSNMFALGADIKWALHEGYKYFPDIALRGGVSTLLGAKDLNLFTASGDVVLSKYFGVFNVMAITPYLGFQRLFITGSSRVLNVYPQDPRTSEVQADRRNRDMDFVPEFVFPQYNVNMNRFFAGSRINVWILSFTAEVMLGETINQFTFAGGVDF